MFEIKLNEEKVLDLKYEGNKAELFKEFGYIVGSIAVKLIDEPDDLDVLTDLCKKSFEFHLNKRLIDKLNDIKTEMINSLTSL